MSATNNIVLLEAGIAGGALVDVTDRLPGDGTFSFDADTMNRINGGALPFGPVNLLVRATDAGGATSDPFNFDFTLTEPELIQLAEEDRFVTEFTVPVPSNRSNDSTITFSIDSDSDSTSTTAAVEDVFNVFLVDPADPTVTLIDQGIPGTPLFSLRGDEMELQAGTVRFDGRQVSVDLTELGGQTEAALLFQLINSDTDQGTTVDIADVQIEGNDDGAQPLAFDTQINLVDPGPDVDLSGFCGRTRHRGRGRSCPVQLDHRSLHRAPDLEQHR